MRIGVILCDEVRNNYNVDQTSVISRIDKCLSNAGVVKTYIFDDVDRFYKDLLFEDDDEMVIIKGNCFIFDLMELKKFCDDVCDQDVAFLGSDCIVFIKGNVLKNNIGKDVFKLCDDFHKYNSSDRVVKIACIEDLISVNKLYYKRNCLKLLEKGVFVYDVDNTYISENVEVDEKVEIYPNNYILGNSVIKSNTVILPNCYIVDSVIGEHCEVGPFSHIKSNSLIGNHNVIGAYVEVKKSELGSFVKSKHHAYLGDVKVGDNVNMGCGVIIANYDGKRKSVSNIGAHSFIGSNVTIVSPVNVGKNVVIGAGSTIVNDISDNSLAIARERQVNKESYYCKDVNGAQKK